MLEKSITGLMLVVAVIHLLPVAGMQGVERLNTLYGMDIDDPAMEILMRHRAILFGILGGFFAYAAFVPSVQPLAFFAAFVSVSSFFALVYAVGDPAGALRSVVIADVVAAVSLSLAVILFLLKRDAY